MKDKTMNIIDTAIPDVKLLEPQVFGDSRGFLWKLSATSGSKPKSATAPSCRKTIPNPAKAYCAACTIKLKTHKANSYAWLSAKYFDVAVDMRKDSPHFRQMGRRDPVRRKQTPTVGTRRFRTRLLCTER